MKVWRLRTLAVIPLAGALLVQPVIGTVTAHGMAYSSLSKIQKRILSGAADLAFHPDQEKTNTTNSRYAPYNSATRSLAAAGITPAPAAYTPTGPGGCPENLSGNIKVNQNCLNLTDGDLQGRAQAQNETSIAIDPSNPTHLVASYNDYRRGDGTCGTTYSLDNGATWTDTTAPTGFVRGSAYGGHPRQYFQAGGDTAVAFDSRGNAYLQCQMFQRGGSTTPNPDVSSAIYVYRSTQTPGSSWNFPGRPVIESADLTGSGLAPFEDKPLMAVDSSQTSAFRDRIYVTWTEFAADGTGYIYESHSSDYGETFSAKVLVSSNSGLCTNNYGLTNPNGNCNENQFADPFLGPGGALYVAYDNYNNTVSGSANWNQVLLSKSTDGGATFAAPVLATEYYDLPDCATYQAGKDPGRECVPEQGPGTSSYFRAANYPSGGVNPANPGQVVITVGSYINKVSRPLLGCTPNGLAADGANLYTGTKVNCSNHILVTQSNDYGATFSGASTTPQLLPITNSTPNADQWFQWMAFTSSGKFVASYYDRQYGTDENTGFSDFSVATSADRFTFTNTLVTTASMPPPSQFSGVFWGDYTGLAAVTDAHPLWSDSRNLDLIVCPGVTMPSICTFSGIDATPANDQDIFSQAVPVP